jgi:hypothetical protein
MTARHPSRTERWLALGALLCAPLLSDCREPTQITLALRTDAQCVDVLGTTITVGELGRLEERPEAATTDRCDPGSGKIGTLVVVPSGANDAEVAMRVVTGVGKSPEQCVKDGYLGGCIVARRAIRYLPHTPLEMPILMSVDCIDIPCGATETCFKGKCVPANVDPEKCEQGNCDPVLPDGGVDGGIDASVDQSSDGDGGSAGASGSSGSGGSAGSGGSGGVDAGDAFAPCTAPAAECDGNPATVCETDLDVDPASCGACGHDCLGGTCSAGKCQPVTLVATGTPTRLAIDATHVYYVDYNGGGVFSVPKIGGTPTTLATGQKSVRIAVDATHVYWTNEQGNDILRVPKLGGATEIVHTANTPYGFALDVAMIYYTELRAGGSVAVVPKLGGVPVPISTGENWPFEVTLAPTHVYWTQLSNNADLRRAPLAGGAPESVLTGLSNPTAVTNDGTTVFVGVLGNGNNKGQVLAVPLAGGATTVLAQAQQQPRGLAVDGVHLYWTNGAGGTVMRIAKDGSDNQVPELLSSGGKTPLGIAIDAIAVYWADDQSSTIQKLAK